ncbi:protein-disulfide reductase DsbD [Microvirga arsenatis]|uniref:Thiol:disulfide interchange protein DsbD n=1 Tax=Microvirga arsenatis TaxID=2692265 RepID=A0ABW9YW46_9HYPH|nr:protein-disulfide reductase DsbD [Microvirga arsenatis]NBJ10707.1 protein-disulfide reductase DsbD [Microvirga arsenatis]NBJ24395.1 protein-disulfide reductase DsbD [Microvirga arsenatis]
MPHNLTRIVFALVALVLGSIGAGAQFNIPSADEVFRFSASKSADGGIILDWAIAPDMYLYRDKVIVSASPGDAKPLPVETSPGQKKDDPTFGETEVYHDAARATVSAGALAAASSPQTVHVTYQGCAEKLGICYPPETKAIELAALPVANGGPAASTGPSQPVEAAASATTAPPTPQTASQDNAWMSGSLASVLATFLGFGLLLTFTPCVLPMIPILSGMLARSGGRLSAGRGFALSVTYVLAMAAAYGLLGVAAAWSGQNLQAALQTPWALGAMSVLFVVLALSMFGLFELQLPSSWTSFISGRTSGMGGSLPGAAALGFTSALIVGPCVTPPLAGALLYVSQTGDMMRGAAALFMLGLGMGLPLIVYGTVGAKALPKSGLWLVRVKQAFGVVFLGVAIAMVSRIAPPQLSLALWAMLAIGAGVFLGAFDPAPGCAARRLAKAAGIAAVLYGGTLVVGAASGATDPLQPLATLARGSAPAVTSELAATRVTTPAEFDAAVETARAQGKPILVDFTAEWCVTCKEIDRTVFADPTVQARLKDVAFIRADVTDYNDGSRNLMQRFGVVGPPTILFLDPKTGQELAPARTIGTIDADGFLQKLTAAGA